MWAVSYESAWRFTAIGSLLAMEISALEQLAIFRTLYSRSGLLNAQVIRPEVVGGGFRFAVVRKLTASPGALFSILGVRVVVGLVLGLALLRFPPSRAWMASGTLVLLVTILLTNRRNLGYGQEGSDQLTFLALAGFWVYQIAAPASAGYYAAGIFVVAEVMLSYVASGVSKLVSRTWRSGEALLLIGRLIEFRFDPVVGLPRRARWLSAWMVMLFEAAFPLALIDVRVCWFFLIAGILFHLTVCVVMGFNRFLIVFLGCYPLILWAATALHRTAGLR
jgi:hypothetical protein